ncbi:hypothetical protein HC256_007341 [Beauveria bassiana]|nr:hypothetical protein HC256_007341 [Beauveria bassiana]
MDGMRLLDQHIDRSLWPIDPAEAATYYFIWDLSPRGVETKRAKENCASGRWPREDDECTILSVSLSRQKLEKEGRDGAYSGGGGGGGGLRGMVRRVCRRGGLKCMQKRLVDNDPMAGEMREKQHQYQHQQKEQNGGRRWSDATLVERRRSLGERKPVKD